MQGGLRQLLVCMLVAASLGFGGVSLAQQQPGSGSGRDPSSGRNERTASGNEQREVCHDGRRMSVRGECERLLPEGSGGTLIEILGGIFGAPRRVEQPAAAKPSPVVKPAKPQKPAGPRRSRRAQSLPASIPIPTPRPDFPGPVLNDLPQMAVAGDLVEDEVLATIEGDAAVAESIATGLGLEVRSIRTSGLLGATVVRYGIPDGRAVGLVLAQLEADGRTLEQAPNHIYTLQQATQIVSYAFQNISLDADEASGANVNIAVIDTAVDDTHPALRDALVAQFDAMPDQPVKDREHGTSIAGLIAGSGPFRGMAPGARLFHARAFEGGRSSSDILLSALDWAAGRNARIINMSFVGPENLLLERACEAARARGIVLVAAAGNNGPGAPFGYPAAYDGVIAVTAVDKANGLMQQANRGSYVDISAPGVNVIAPIPGGADAVTGTSFAAAIVSGAIANLLREQEGLSPDHLSMLLAKTAVDLGAPGHDDDFGHGLLNASAARQHR